MEKKLISFMCAIMLVFSAVFVTGCSNSKTSDNSNKQSQKQKTNKEKDKTNEKIKIGALKGPTGIGMVNLMEEEKDDYDISIYNSPDEIVSKIVTGELDAAAVPSNLASVLYNKTKGNIQLTCVNTLGMLYIVENGNTIKNIKDLKGKTVYSSGKGATPEFIFNYILQKNGLDPQKDIKVEYINQHSDLAAAIISKKANIAVLPEPFITMTKSKDKELNVPINLNKEWEKISEGHNKLMMGAVIFRKDFVEKRHEDVDEFLEDYKESIDFVNKDTKKASKLTEKYEIIKNAKIAEEAIPKCNITFIDAQSAKECLTDFYEILFSNDPKSVGGKLPSEDFYYKIY